MKLLRQTHKIEYIQPNILQHLEIAARNCYKSENKINDTSAENLLKNIIKNKHLSVLEHANMTIRFITNRTVSHQLVRHRTGIVFSQESQRYCTYNNHVQFIIPERIESLFKLDQAVMNFTDIKAILNEKDKKQTIRESALSWLKMCLKTEMNYHSLLFDNWPSEDARGVLSNDVKTEIVVTANIREWRYIFELRITNKCQYNMRVLMRKTLDEVKTKIPLLFDDIGY